MVLLARVVHDGLARFSSLRLLLSAVGAQGVSAFALLWKRKAGSIFSSPMPLSHVPISISSLDAVSTGLMLYWAAMFDMLKALSAPRIVEEGRRALTATSSGQRRSFPLVQPVKFWSSECAQQAISLSSIAEDICRWSLRRPQAYIRSDGCMRPAVEIAASKQASCRHPLNRPDRLDSQTSCAKKIRKRMEVRSCS